MQTKFLCQRAIIACGLDKQVDVWVRFDIDMKQILICLLTA